MIKVLAKAAAANVLKEVERLVLKPPRPNDDCNVLYKLVTNQRSRLPLLKRKK